MKEICGIKVPVEIKYSEHDEWVSHSLPHRVGVSDFVQDLIGELLFAELPPVGAEFKKGQEFGALESYLGARPLISPADLKVVAINDELNNDPTLVNRSPYGQGWVIEVKLKDPDQVDCLMDAEAYKKSLESKAL